MTSDSINRSIIDIDPEKNASPLSRQILNLLRKELPSLQKSINKAFDLKQKEKLNQLLHKLSSSCIYCRLTQLKASLITLNSSIKNGLFRQKELDHLNQEIERVLTELEKLN
ncbi:Hpt domain-containing protein [Rickettsiella massiliensis]|uniref:Hpt domain-containing protein n=1 Tax=Rickettsiella massiliensis TaxID=676517 RepID=UPI00029AECA1|nr:Hpt domain-containing protein [Rickettsiella massiliensis]